MFLCRALRVRKKMSGEKMPVKMIGDILSAQLPHMQPYIRFCSCQLNGAALIQQKTDEAPDFKEFVKVRQPGLWGDPGVLPVREGLTEGPQGPPSLPGKSWVALTCRRGSQPKGALGQESQPWRALKELQSCAVHVLMVFLRGVAESFISFSWPVQREAPRS